MRIACLTAADMLPGHPARRSDGFEHDVQFAALRRAGAAQGLEFEVVVWDAPETDWHRYDAAFVGAAWDYAQKRDAFFETLSRIDAAVPLFNPLGLMRWNADKIYLRDLAHKGAPSIASFWADAATPRTIAAAFDALEADEIVIKPRIGANAWQQVRLRRGAPVPERAALPPAACFMQPFLPSLPEYGEISLLYYDGIFSHGVRKIPRRGDYRVQSDYGARERAHTPDAAERRAAQTILRALPGLPLYARIDLVRDPQNAPVLMEAELIEPYHYPQQGADFARHLAVALTRRLRA